MLTSVLKCQTWPSHNSILSDYHLTQCGYPSWPRFRSALLSIYLSLTDGHHLALFDDAFSILHGLLTSIPTFWGSGEVTQVVFLHMDLSSSQSKPLVSALALLSKSLAKRIPPKVLLSTLSDMWKPSQSFSQLVCFYSGLSNFPHLIIASRQKFLHISKFLHGLCNLPIGPQCWNTFEPRSKYSSRR